MRVVSHTCSNTEIVCALGCADRLIAVDSDSDFPPEVVSGLVQLGRDLNLDVQRVVDLKPDLVLTSLTVPGHERIVDELAVAGLRCLVIEPHSLADVFQNIREIAAALGVATRGDALVREMDAAMPPVPVREDAPRVLVEWWPKPVIGAARRSWVQDLIVRAGGVNALGDVAAATATPEHPPWERREAPRTPDQPLLVPTFGQKPEDRPATLDGRVFGSGQWSRDAAGDRSSDYLYARLGVSLEGRNHLGRGEVVRFAGELDDRRVSVADRDDEDDLRARLDLVSIAFGTEQWAPTGIEIGRFYSQGLPESGLIDGLEVVRRYEGGVKIGGGVGAYPLPFPNRGTGDDVGAHAFFDYVADDRRSFGATLGAQKTWHRGDEDRDLLVLRSDARPTDRLSLWASAKVDVYTGADTIKGSGVQLTEAYVSARWDERAVGFGLTGSRFTWPELLRDEYQALPVELVRDGFVDRFGGSVWWRVRENLRLAARADRWHDQDRSGTSWGLDGDVAGVLGECTYLFASVFGSDGSNTSGPGARLGLRAPLGDGWWRLGYRRLEYELTGLATGPETLSRQSAELGLSMPLGLRSDLDCQVEHWFGDDEDVWALSVYWQWRF